MYIPLAKMPSMPHITIRVTEEEREQYKILPLFEHKDLTAIIKKHLNKLFKKHSKTK